MTWIPTTPKSVSFSRGGSIGSLFSSLFSRALPFLKSVGKTAVAGLKKAAQSDTAKQLGSDLAATSIAGLADAGLSVLAGSDPREGIESRLGEAKNLISGALEKKLKETKANYGPKPKKRKQQERSKRTNKRHKKEEPFDLLSN